VVDPTSVVNPKTTANPERTREIYDVSAAVADLLGAVFTDLDTVTAVTVGNKSYIPVDSQGNLGGDSLEVLLLLGEFEDAYPELEITGWVVEERQDMTLMSPIIFGIWVDHKPRD